MRVRVSIGEFSRMTYLSVKALRHYQDLGLLAPAEVDPVTGYRYYDASQVPLAQVIRRLRDLGMPLPEVRAVVGASDVTVRNEAILRHLARIENQLAQTQTTLASLRALLERPAEAVVVEYRSVPATLALAVSDRLAMAEVEGWWAGAFDELHACLRQIGVPAAGPGGALYSKEFFEEEQGDVVAFVPVHTEVRGSGRASAFRVPPAELAVAVHRGSFSELDQTYGALGTYVAEREIGVEGPIREYYIVTSADTDDETQHRTEVCWPVFHTKPRDQNT